MYVSSSHIWNPCLLYRLVCGSRQFLLDRYLIMEETSIYEEQVTEVANSLISSEEETLKCYQAVGNVYESCWIHFSDITDVIFNKKKQVF